MASSEAVIPGTHSYTATFASIAIVSIGSIAVSTLIISIVVNSGVAIIVTAVSVACIASVVLGGDMRGLALLMGCSQCGSIPQQVATCTTMHIISLMAGSYGTITMNW